MALVIRFYITSENTLHAAWIGDPETDTDPYEGLFERVPTGPDSGGMLWDPIDQSWSFPFDLVSESETKRVEMRSAAAYEITETKFESSALGTPHQYDSRLVDQVNIQMRYALALINDAPEPIYADSGSGFEWLPHTAVQLLTVMGDMNLKIKSAQTNLADKMTAVDMAATRNDLKAIVWP